MPFDIRKQFHTDEKLEIEGVWEDLIEASEGESEPPGLLIARVGNKAYLREFQKIPIGLRRQLDNNTLPEGKGEQIINRLLAKTILLNWRHIRNDGVDIEYSYENAFKELSDEKDFREFVWAIASDQTRFREEELEEMEKNSESASPGS